MKKSFLIYHDQHEPIKVLSQEEKGDLLDAMFLYNTTGKEPELEGMVKMAFMFFKSGFDRNNKKWEDKAERNRENGKKGGRPKKNENKGLGDNPENPNEPKEPSGLNDNPENPNEPVSVSGSVKVSATSVEGLVEGNEEEPLHDEPCEQQEIFDEPKKPKDEFKGNCPAANKNSKLYHPKFCEFWEEYPVRENGAKGSKWNAFQQWWRVVSQKLLTPDELIGHIKRLKFSYNGYPKDAERWLKSAMWQDVPIVPSVACVQQTGQSYEEMMQEKYANGNG